MTLLTLEQAATFLGITKASVRNWERHGYIKTIHNKKYAERDLLSLKNKISSGQINRLNKRANKINSKNQFIPTEYINNSSSIIFLNNIISFIIDNKIKPEQALFLLSVNVFSKNTDIDKQNIYSALQFENDIYFKRRNVFLELKDWFKKISKGKITEDNKYCKFLLEVDIPEEEDFLGIVYQSIMHEGKKSALGSYYTPKSMVNSIITDGLDYSKVLDPCCGTGQFLLAMSRKIENPLNIWGCDIDEIAVRISRVNLLLHYSDFDYKPNIFNLNSLLEFKETSFSFIATNPPWGAKFSKEDLKKIKDVYPEINSNESFSFFLNLAIIKLIEGGTFSFVLPESILYIKNHQDIRKILLKSTLLKTIESSGRLFKNVFSSVIKLEGVKSNNFYKNEVKVYLNDIYYKIDQDRFLNNYNNIFNIYCNNKEEGLIGSVYAHPHTTLLNNSNWALGIVTGNNSKFIANKLTDGYEPIFKGKDLGKLKLLEPSGFIDFKPQSYQQCAPIEFYRSPEKLIYKFINKELVFAYDNNKHLTLNSANILIPKIEGLSIKIIGALLNSKLYNFIYLKKFNALKVLRSDIETLPIPILQNKQIVELENLIEKYLQEQIDYVEIDDYILSIFNIDKETFTKITCILK